MTTLLTGPTNGQRFTIPSELPPDELNEILSFAESFEGSPALPTTIDEIHALAARLKDDDDENGLPAGLPTKRYWPDLDAFNEMPVALDNDTLSGRIAYRKLWRVRLWKINPFCRWCAFRVSKDKATLEHIIPQSRGGLDHGLNYAMACARCNSMKSDLTPTEYVQLILTGMLPRAAAEARIIRQMTTNRRVEGFNVVEAAEDTEGGEA